MFLSEQTNYILFTILYPLTIHVVQMKIFPQKRKRKKVLLLFGVYVTIISLGGISCAKS